MQPTAYSTLVQTHCVVHKIGRVQKHHHGGCNDLHYDK